MKLSATLFLVASSLALLESVSAAVDPCTLVSQWPNRTKTYGGWEQSKACLENFPFNNAVAQQTLDTVIDTWDAFFVFKDIAARPPQSYLSIKNVDLIEELKALKNKKYNSDFAFQNDIQNIAFSLYDAHLNYEPQTIEDSGKYKDLNVRFNNALTSNHRYVKGNFEVFYGSWQVRHQLPTKPLTKYHLHCPNKKVQTLTLPWVVVAPRSDYNDSASYYAQECAVEAPSKVRRSHEAPSVLTENPRSLLGKAGDAHIPHPFNVASNYTLITSDEMFLFLYLSKGNGVHHKTGIINIGTFEPENVTLSVQTFYLGMRKFKTLGIEKIIIDVQNNGAQTLLHILFNHINTNFTTPDLEYGTDILVTRQSLVLGTLQASNTGCSFGANYETLNGKPLTDNSWLTDSIKYTRGGKTSRYSQRVRTNCTDFITDYYSKDLGVLPWKPKDCLILSNGICGSSCALFANRMHELEHVKTMAVGGILHNPMTYQSFPGLQG
ncbi:hypothetical protein BC938DRAFT_475164 [Jimgerdemannia flammicorona]|uniref:Tail specific protease domain-containing protein n=1 Tax=Jimgerdemannia flammicorona TaxID=994334 RepID=A0A433PZK3_9FUNG|nr:hypothetical protein BC938DRAFT_475164 [Jimgerdemannia flammicorona]